MAGIAIAITPNETIFAAFYRESAELAMQSHVLAAVQLSVCLSVYLSVRLSHAGTVKTTQAIGSRNLHQWLAQGL